MQYIHHFDEQTQHGPKWCTHIQGFQECFWVSGTTCARLSTSPSHSEWFVKVTRGKQIRVWFEFFPQLRVKSSQSKYCLYGLYLGSRMKESVWFLDLIWLGTVGNNSSQTQNRGKTSPSDSQVNLWTALGGMRASLHIAQLLPFLFGCCDQQPSSGLYALSLFVMRVLQSNR